MVALEIVGVERGAVHHGGQNVAPEVVAAALVGRIIVELADQSVVGEDVVAHGGEHAFGIARNARRVGVLLVEAGDAAVRRRLDDAELDRQATVHRNGRHGGFGSARGVELDHGADVHAVDVIGPEDGHDVGMRLFHQVDVLEDGIGGALVPGFLRRAHLRRHGDDEVVIEQAAELPAVAEVLQQRLALELRQDVDGIDPGVDQVAKDEVNDAVLATKRDGRLGPFLGERIKAGSLPSREHERQNAQFHPTGPPYKSTGKC